MLNLPQSIFSFWYLQALNFFFRTWKNTISLIEEDLAVGLMFKLLFIPLFHDSTIFGRLMSFVFRLTRILMGLLAYFFTTILFVLLGLVWFSLPILFFYPSFVLISILAKLLFLFGVFIFAYRLTNNPSKKVAEIKDISEINLVTKLKKEELTWVKLTEDREVLSFLESLEISAQDLGDQNISISDSCLNLVLNLAKETKLKYLTGLYFFYGLLSEVPLIDNQLLKINLSLKDFEDALKFYEYKRVKYRTIYIWDEDFATTHLKGVNRGWLGAPTPTLDSVSDDLTRFAAKHLVVDFVGRVEVVEEVINILSQESGRNVLLVGPPGAGKTTLVSYLAKKIITGDAPAALATKRIVNLDFTKLLSGITTQGELAERVQYVFEEAKFVENTIIFIDEIQNLGIGEAGTNFNLFSLLLPYLEGSEIQFISTTEIGNYARIVEKNGAFARVFTKVEIPPASIDETLRIILENAVDLEKFKGIKLTFKAAKLLVELSAKLIHNRVLPDSALAILNEAKAIAKNNLINSAVIKEVLSKRVNVPIEALGNIEKEKLLNLEDQIHQQMVDQEEAVKSVADTLRRAAVSLREQARPIGSFLFVGPTGVGKTELAKSLAQIYFSSSGPADSTASHLSSSHTLRALDEAPRSSSPDANSGFFIRFDMSEYQTDEAVNRLIGTENSPGELTEKIKNKPYCLILLDEFEKANPKILNLFLQVLDDGRLTDVSGTTVDFTNTIIIATSNAASLIIAEGLSQGLDLEKLNILVREELLKVYKPELINRFDDVVIFKPLSLENLEKIVKMKLDDLSAMLKKQGYLIEFKPDLISELAKKGYDSVLGARPLRRLIQDTLEAKLSIMILENKINKGQNYQAGLDLLS